MKRQFVWVFSSRVLATLIQAAIFVALARLVSPESFGLANALIGLGFIGVALADLGIGTYVLRAWAVDGSKGHIRTALKLNRETTSFFIVIFAFFIWFLARATDQSVLMQMIPLAAWAGAEKMGDIWLNVALAANRASISSRMLLLRRSLAAAIFFVLILLGLPPIFGFSLALAIGSTLGALATVRIVSKLVPYAEEEPRSLILRRCFPFLVSNLSGQARNLDIAIVAAVVAPASAGYYSAATRLTAPALTLAGALASVMLPHASRSSTTSVRRLAQKSFIASSVLVVLSLAVSVPLAEPVLVLLFGDEYGPGAPILQIMIIAVILIGLSPTLGGLLQSLSNEKAVAINGVVFAVILLLALYAGAALHGVLGVVVALVAVAFLKSASLFLLIIIRTRPLKSAE